MKYLGNDKYILKTTGRECYANNGIIGLDPNLETSEGYDGGFEDGCKPFTAKERREIADFMINLWAAYGDSKPTEKIDDF